MLMDEMIGKDEVKSGRRFRIDFVAMAADAVR